MTSTPRVVALGGGHGLAASLGALRRVTDNLTAIVTVADDGWSSGRLRADLDALPPGDLRMALSALAAADDECRTWSDLFQHRFAAGPLSGHAVGNLVLVGLSSVLGSEIGALDLCARLLGIKGRVLPMTLERIEIVAQVTGLLSDLDAPSEVRGQHEVTTTKGTVRSVDLEPAHPSACPEAITAVSVCDYVVLGPGSLFTSVFPHLLVPQLRDAIMESSAEVIFCLNLTAQTGETTGFSPEAHLDALSEHFPDLRIDHVLADTSVLDRDGLMATATKLGARVLFAPVASEANAAKHDPLALASAYGSLMSRPAEG
jgi:uncharacterized cofD-like protein